MKKITVVYWSGTGNTQTMAEAVAEGIVSQGANASILSVDKAAKQNVIDSDAFALGCPAMGDEVLEESEMEPFMISLEGEKLAGKPVALFGSYDWGSGQWMRDWEERLKNTGASLVADGLTVQGLPDDAVLAECRELGKKLVLALA